MIDPKDPFLDELDDGDIEALEKALADLPAAPPKASLRDALLGAAATTHRFEELVVPFAEAADIDHATAEALLLAVDDPDRWEGGPAPWIHLIHFDGGPKTARSITGIVKIDPGESFPHHGHMGDEVVLVLQGEAESDGKTYRRGDLVRAGVDDEHDVRVTSDIPLVYLAVVAEGIRIGDDEITFDDPRG